MKSAKSALARIATYIRQYPSHILSAVLILLAIAVVYWSDFEILINELLNNEATTHVILVPFFVGFLLYRKKGLS